jgi:transposase
MAGVGDAHKEYGPSNTLYNRWKQWSGKCIFPQMMDALMTEAAVLKTVMLNVSYLTVHRTATNLRSKKARLQLEGPSD